MGIKGLKWIQEKKEKMAMKRMCKGMARACKKYELEAWKLGCTGAADIWRDNSEKWLARAKEF